MDKSVSVLQASKLVAGILPWRNNEGQIEFFLGKSGGPWFSGKEASWTIMKGHLNEGEEIRRCAEREFKEESGWSIDLDRLSPTLLQFGRFFIFLAQIPTLDSNYCKSNTFELNGTEYPEITDWNWINANEVLAMTFKSQRPVLTKAIQILTACNSY